MKTFAKFKKIISKSLVLSSILVLGFILTGCQQTQTQKTGENIKQQKVQPQKSLFFFGNDKVKESSSGDVGKDLKDVDSFVNVELETEIPDKLYKGVQFPLSLKVENFNYLNPSNEEISPNFMAGTSISNSEVKLTYAIGGSSDLNVQNSEGDVTVPLAQYVNGKVIPHYSYKSLGTISFTGSIGSLTKKYIQVNVCYPVFKKDEFTLLVPAKTKTASDAYINKNIDIVPNNGEIKYEIQAQGTPSGEGYVYNLIIKVSKNLDQNEELATDNMESCGPVPSVTSGHYPEMFFNLKGPKDATIDCNFADNKKEGQGNIKFYKDGVTFTCKISFNKRDISDKEFPFAIYSAYTVVKTIKSNEFSIEG